MSVAPAGTLLRRPLHDQPPAAQHAVTRRGGAGVRFLPVRRASMAGALLAALLFGAPAAVLGASLAWLAARQPLGLLVLVGVGAVVAACFWVLVAQGLRVQAAWLRLRRQRAALRGDEGLYIAEDWLLLVRGPQHASLLRRQDIDHLLELRVCHPSHCEIFPCAALRDGRHVVLRLPALQHGPPPLEDLLASWQIPHQPRRLDVPLHRLAEFEAL